MSLSRDEVIDKIKKLWELGKSGNEHEAAAANARAAELLAKYNLEQYEVEEASLERQEILEEEVHATGYSNKLQWVVDLAAILADANFCYVFWRGPHPIFVGAKTDLEVCVFMFQNLRSRLDTLATKRTYEYTCEMRAKYGLDESANMYQLLMGKHHPRVWRTSWLIGAIIGVKDKLSEVRRTFDVSEKTHAMVLVKNAAVVEWVHAKYPRMGKFSMSGQENSNPWAARDGYKHGKSMEVNRAIETNSSATNLLPEGKK